MALTSNVLLPARVEGPNVAMGSRTGTRTAANFTITTGFAPKYVRVVNLTDRVEIEYFVDSNLDATSGNVFGLKTVAAGTRTYEAGGISVLTTEGASGRQFAVTVATAGLETDNDDVVWIAMG
jgi:hypothetical protein